MKTTELNCTQISELLPPLCFGELELTQSEQIHDHLAECAACMDEYLDLAMALQKSKEPFEENELKLNSEQVNAIQRATWKEELEIVSDKLDVKPAKKASKNININNYDQDKKRFPWTAVAAIFIIVPIIGAMILPALGTARNKSQAKKAQNDLKMRLLEAEMSKYELEEKLESATQEVSDLKNNSGKHLAQINRLEKHMSALVGTSEDTMAPPPPPEIPAPEPQEAVSFEPQVISDAVFDTTDLVGAIDDVSDEPPSTDDSAETDLVNDVKPSASSIVSSKMFGGRSSAGRASALKSYGGSVRAPLIGRGGDSDGDEDVDIFGDGEVSAKQEAYAFAEKKARESRSKRQEAQSKERARAMKKAVAKSKAKKDSSLYPSSPAPISEAELLDDPFAEHVDGLTGLSSTDLTGEDFGDDHFGDDHFGEDHFGEDHFGEEQLAADDGLSITGNTLSSKELSEGQKVVLESKFYEINQKDLDELAFGWKMEEPTPQRKNLRLGFSDTAQSPEELKQAQAQVLYGQGRYTDSKDVLEQILVQDPFNEEATVMLRRVSNKMEAEGLIDRKATRTERLAQVDWKWNPPLQLSSQVIASSSLVTGDQVPADKDSPDIFEKSNNIIIPSIVFDNDSLDSVVSRLKKMSKDYDPSPEKKGVNIILRVSSDHPAISNIEDLNLDDDPFAEEILEEVAEASSDEVQKGVSLNLNNVPLIKALELVALQNDLKYKVTEHAIILADKSVQLDTMEVRFYNVPEGFLSSLKNRKNIAEGDNSKKDIANFMHQQGIELPAGSQISFIESVNRLVVKNTPEEHQKVDTLLKKLTQKHAAERIAELKAKRLAEQKRLALEKRLAELKAAKERQAILEAQLTKTPDISLPAPIFFENMVDTAENNKSTFAIDVDTASYTAARNEIRSGRKPRPESIRLEEFINHFDYHYNLPQDQSFHIDSELTSHRVYGGVKLLRVGIQGQRLGADAKKPGSYTFVIDNSGSMAAEDRLPLIQKTLPAMFKRMNKNDQVTILSCEDGVKTLAQNMKASQHERLTSIVNNISPGSVANLSDGIVSAYKNASHNFQTGAVNRVILMSDGIASLGGQEADKVLNAIDTYRQQGIGNTVIGVGSRDFDDQFLEKLANKGDGAYYFGDSENAMKDILVNNFDASFHTIARDVKIQVEFNPRAVRSYRLLGYEKRRLANKDFRNDKVDAGEVGAGQSVSALYEIVLSNEIQPGSLGQVNLRYKQAEGDLVTEINNNLGMANQNTFSESSVATRLAWCASTFARLLKSNGQAEISFHGLVAEVDQILAQRPHDQKIHEFKELIIRCQSLY